MLLNPKLLVTTHPDPVLRLLIEKTIAFFEAKGKRRLIDDDLERVWYEDFLAFIKAEKVFATLLTSTPSSGGEQRWDTSRLSAFNEVLAFYGLCYWYTWQVSILGLGPLWMSKNETARKKTAALLEQGAIFAFGLSEKEHGADIYATDMLLVPVEQGYVARGDKYYIGNGNQAAIVSTFGRVEGTGEYVFFAVNSQHPKFECVKNVTATQSYVSEFILHDYPIAEDDILSRGDAAWEASLNTVNIGKYNLGWASIGICTHALYEALNHAAHRRLYGHAVTDFPHVKRLFTDAYARLVAMKLFALRAADYFRIATPEDRRYLLYNPVMKMKVTTQGEEVIDLLWEVIAAKGFEKDTYFSIATRDIRALPKLEGTVHVNIALIVKFMRSYFFDPQEFAAVGRQLEAANDDFLFNQGPTKGLGKIRFHDYHRAYAGVDVANVHVFAEQIACFKACLVQAPLSDMQQKDIDLMLAVGELFTLAVYAQLILENVKLLEVSSDILDQIFDFLIRDFSRFALQFYSKPNSSPEQMAACLEMIRKPRADDARSERIWTETVYALRDQYEMSP
jgi:acyl-CoA dehydrogenase